MTGLPDARAEWRRWQHLAIVRCRCGDPTHIIDHLGGARVRWKRLGATVSITIRNGRRQVTAWFCGRCAAMFVEAVEQATGINVSAKCATCGGRDGHLPICSKTE